MCITLFPSHGHTICLQYNGLFQQENIGIEDMEFSAVREMKILEISYFVFPPGKQFRTARVDR